MKKEPAINSLIGDNVTITGQVKFHGGLHIDGNVIGDVLSDGPSSTFVHIAPRGAVSGDVTADYVIVEGEVRGALTVRYDLEIGGAAKVDGDVRYRTAKICIGAHVEGKLSHDTNIPLSNERSLSEIDNGDTSAPHLSHIEKLDIQTGR